MNEFDNQEKMEADGIFSKVLRAGRRTYFFDVRETRAGDYYLTITESKKNTGDDGAFFYKKHKIYLYKEDFEAFQDLLGETTKYVFHNKGEEVISERHQKDFDAKKSRDEADFVEANEPQDVVSFTNLEFEDI